MSQVHVHASAGHLSNVLGTFGLACSSTSRPRASTRAAAALLAGAIRRHGTTVLCATPEGLVLAACDDRLALEPHDDHGAQLRPS